MKGEEDKLSREERLLREAQWERQRREEEAVRMAAEMRRRRMLAEENRQKQTRKVYVVTSMCLQLYGKYICMRPNSYKKYLFVSCVNVHINETSIACYTCRKICCIKFIPELCKGIKFIKTLHYLYWSVVLYQSFLDYY